MDAPLVAEDADIEPRPRAARMVFVLSRRGEPGPVASDSWCLPGFLNFEQNCRRWQAPARARAQVAARPHPLSDTLRIPS